MSDNSEYGGTLNREARRALNKHLKSTTNALFSMTKESASETLVNRANKIIKTHEKPFELQLKEVKIDVIAHAVYLVCKQSKTTVGMVQRTEEEFFLDMGIDYIDYLRSNDIDISEDELKSIMYLAEKSGNIENYLKVYKMCQISSGTSMETCIRAALSVSLYTLMEKASTYNKENKKKNVMLAIKHETGYSCKNEPVELRFELLNMCIMLYWMHRIGLSDGSVIKSEVGIDLSCDLTSIINKNIPESTSYERWVKGEITFEEAIVECEDIQKIAESRLQYYLGLSKGIRAMLVEASIVCKSTQKMVTDLERYKSNEESLTEKIQSSKKMRLELQKEVKSIKKQLSEMEKRNSKLKSEISMLEKQERGGEKLEQELIQLKSRITELSEELADSKNKSIVKDKELLEVREINEVNSRKLNMTINLYEDAKRYIEDLTEKGEIDYEVPIDIVISKISSKRIAICGGRETLESNMVRMGISSIKHFSAGKIPTIKEIGLFDCLVIITQQVAHKSIMKIRQFAKDTGKPIVYFNGSNIENMCREIYSALS